MARFCTQCGKAVQRTPMTAAANIPVIEGELKQITVLFSDVFGSTELIEALDPEEADRRLSPCIEAMKEAVHRFEGTVVKIQGDGIMALFGAPNPQEDHAVRACCAALAMQAAFKTLPSAPPVRVGMHSGEVLARVIANDFANEFDATGLAVHIANRLQNLAPPGGIALSSATLRGARQFVSVESLGAQPIRGLSAPLEIFLLTGLRRGPNSQRFSGEVGRSDFVGRDAELALLERGLERASEGDGCAVGLVADAGVGKSRLCFEFAERCRASGIRVLEGLALAHSRATPFEPVIDVVKALFEIAPDDTPERAREKIIATLQSVNADLGSDLALLFDFLAVADPAVTLPRADPVARRERLNGLFRRLIRTAGTTAPAVILLEDLHFLDSGASRCSKCWQRPCPARAFCSWSTSGLATPRPGCMAIITIRSRWRHCGGERPIRWPHGCSAMTRSVMTLLALIADRARGNPLFIEELVRKFEESGHLAGERGAYRLLRTPDMHLVPDTVQAIIGARIDGRPEAEKSILQTAAVIGREFALPVLARLVGGLASQLGGMMHRLAGAGLVYETGAGGGEGLFAFRHPMVQDVAYHSLLSEKRRTLHASVAAELEKTLPDPNGAQANFLAYHWEEAGNPLQAASYSMKAGTWHGTRDPAQALEAWKRARRLLIGLPLQGPQRYPLLMASGQIVNLAWREGLTAVDVEPYYAEALAIARELHDMRAVTLLTAAYGRALAASGSAEDYVATVTEALATVDDSVRNASLRVVLTAILCHALRLSGDLPRALEANDRALAHVKDIDDIDQQTLGFSIAIWINGMRAQILTMMGRFDEARPLLDAMIAADDATVDVLHRLLAHITQCDIAWALSDLELLDNHSKQALQLAERSGNPYLMVYGKGYVGLAQAMRGAHSDATTTLSDALAYARRRNAGLENEARLLADLAHVQLRAGLADRARDTAEEAAAVARRRGAKVWLAYSEWLIGGPASASFNTLVDTTGAELLRRLSHPGA